jgi:hypothetical protein
MREMTRVVDEVFRIRVIDDKPVFKKQYRLSYAEFKLLKEIVEERVDCGFIRPSMSEYAAPTTMLPKKDENGNWTLKRSCGDYRGLNEISVIKNYQIPTTEEIFDQLATSKWFTTLDIKWGYHQVAIAEEECCKTAFWGHDGLYEWVVISFGLKNAPAFFQRLMDKTLRNECQFARAYIDDVIIHSPDDFDEHMGYLRTVFIRLREKRIKCHPKKMRLAECTVAYIGHNVVFNGIAPQAAKVEAIVKMPPPTNITELRAFLGTTGYHRRYVQHYARIAGPLHKLLEQGVAYIWI